MIKINKNNLNSAAMSDKEYYGSYDNIEFGNDPDILDYLFDLFEGTVIWLSAIADSEYEAILLEVTTLVRNKFSRYTADGWDLMDELQTQVDYGAESMDETWFFAKLVFAIRDYVQKLLNSKYGNELRKISVREGGTNWTSNLLLELCNNVLEEEP